MSQQFLGREGTGARRRLRGVCFLATFFLAIPLLVLGLSEPGNGQQLPNLSPDQLQQLQQQFGGGSSQGTAAPAVPNVSAPVVIQPDGGNSGPEPESRLEQIMSRRANVQLNQFGYDKLGRASAMTVPQTGAVQDDYVLGPGDEIAVSLRGQENSESRAVVDRNGQVILPRLAPIAASGRSFGSFRQDLEAAVRRAYVASTASVSITRVRQISVQVAGEVNNPGQQLLTGLASALDAILLRGGIKKTGSLRNVRIMRGGRSFNIDLYSVLRGDGTGGAARMRLADGDRIVVPLLGPTVAISGLVRVPGIYELPNGQKNISVRNLVAMAGGEEVRGLYRMSVIQVDAQGRTELVPLRNDEGVIGDSELLFVQFGADQMVSRVTLAGGTGLAGGYPISQTTKLSDLLKSPGALGANPYTLFGIVSRRDPNTQLRTLAAFTPLAVLNGAEDMTLQSDDIVRPLSVDEIRILVTTLRDFSNARATSDEAIRNPLAAVNLNAPVESNEGQAGAKGASAANSPNTLVPSTPTTVVAPAAAGLSSVLTDNFDTDQRSSEQSSIDTLGGKAVSTRTGAQAPTTQSEPLTFRSQATPNGAPYDDDREISNFNQLAQQLGIDRLVLINFLLDREVILDGALLGPGIYLIGPDVALKDLIQAAGGIQGWTDESNVEVTSTVIAGGQALTRRASMSLHEGLLPTYMVKPKDEFRFNQVFTDINIGSATVQGEVKYPGIYRLRRGEKISDLLARAGGLTSSAYPYGTIFLRKSVATRERENYIRTAQEVENQLVVAMTRIGNDKIDPSTFAAMQGFVSDLRNQKAVGRISVSADPATLVARPQTDFMLESGDVLYIPPRSNTVSVLGQVQQAGTYPYDSTQSVGDYVARAGGNAQYADESGTFIVLPDGSARKIEKSWLHYTATAIPPGSAIVVPRDMSPLDTRQLVIDVAQVFSQFAVSIASIAVLAKQ